MKGKRNTRREYIWQNTQITGSWQLSCTRRPSSSSDLEHLNFIINWELMSWTNLEDTSFIWSALGSEHAYRQRGYDLF